MGQRVSAQPLLWTLMTVFTRDRFQNSGLPPRFASIKHKWTFGGVKKCVQGVCWIVQCSLRYWYDNASIVILHTFERLMIWHNDPNIEGPGTIRVPTTSTHRYNLGESRQVTARVLPSLCETLQRHQLRCWTHKFSQGLQSCRVWNVIIIASNGNTCMHEDKVRVMKISENN